jgi:anti-sigma-K factor RskA
MTGHGTQHGGGPVPPRPGDRRPGDRRPDDAATRELLGVWALDALDDADRAAVEDLIARDPDAAREARSLRETAAVLGAAVAVPAPEEVRAAVLEQVTRTSQEGGGHADDPQEDPPRPHVAAAHTIGAAGTGPSAGPRSSRPADGRASTAPAGRPAAGPAGRPARRRRGTWRSVAATLAVLVAVAVPSTLAWRESQRAADAQARADRITELLAEHGARVAAAEVTTGGTAVAVVTADAALVTATGITEPGADRVYQLWVMRDGVPVPDATAMVSDGALEIATDAFRTGDALALTVEPAGGSDAPTTEPVVVLAPA